jgi:CBS domain-containing protein
MLYPVEKLLPNRDKVLCIKQKETVRDALIKMIQNDYSQLPVVDEGGNLVGIITEKTIIRTYYHISERVPLFNLTVDHCLSPAVTLSIDQDIFEALDQLQRTYAVVIIEGRKPIGLLTHYDTTHFFRDLTEGLIIVEDIETTLRQYIESIYESEERLNQALINAFGANGDLPNREYERLSFGQYIQLIIHKKNWADFEPCFSSAVLFEHLMNEVRQIRNQIAHFRGDLDVLQSDALLTARNWLASRPKPKHDKPDFLAPKDVVTVPPEISRPEFNTTPEPGKYAPLTNWLQRRSRGGAVQMTFDELETLLQEPLPSSASEHRSWWANDTTANRQSRAWMSAGWLVTDVDVTNATVTFQETVGAYYQLFFEDLVQRINARRPGLIKTTAPRPKSWLSFSSGISGLSYVWTFAHGPKFCVELYIATGNTETNKQYYDRLHRRKQTVETRMGMELNWERLDKKGASRVRLERPSRITVPHEELESLKEWAVAKMLDFIDAFQPLLRELFSG